MRPPGVFVLPLLLLFFLQGVCCLAGCPAQLPQGCLCQKGQSSVRVLCRDLIKSAQIAEILTSLGAIRVDRLELRNVSGALEAPWPEARVGKLHLVGGEISDVPDGIFESLGAELTELAIQNASIKRFPTFGHLTQLTSLDLSGNLIEEVREEAIAGLERLRRLRLADNRICSMSTSVLTHSKTIIELLDLSGNCFATVPAQNLRNAVNLKFLDLSRNQVSAVNNFELMNVPELRELRLDSNRISSISAMALMNIPQLEVLNLRNNSLESVDSIKLQAFTRLTSLDFGYNRFTRIPSIHDLSRLQRIRMDHNRLEAVSTLAFSANPRLESIDLSSNQIASVSRNSFDSLDRLSVLQLADNRIESLYKGMFDGIRNLQQLSLKQNLISSIDPNTFDSIRHLVLLDLSKNSLSQIAAGTFAPFKSLFWLDLSENSIEHIEKDAFTFKVANILLHNNALQCDEAFHWLPEYLVINRVRTFLPLQPDIRCAGPENLANVRLKDVMIQVANETMASAPSTPQPQLLNNLFGALGINPAVMQTALQSSNLPTTPISPQNVQIRQMMQAAPSMIVAVPGIGNVDISKLSPDIIAYVLHGGQIPGIPKATLDEIVAEYKQKMVNSGAVNPATIQKLQNAPLNQGTLASPPSALIQPQPGSSASPLPNVPNLLSQLNGAILPTPGGNGTAAAPAFQIPPEAISLMRILPPGYDLSKIPVDVVNSIMKGQIPDFTALPKDLQAYLMANIDKFFPTLNNAAPNVTIEELLAKLPTIERPEVSTYAPYDISKIGNDLISDEDEGESARLRLYTAIGLGVVGVFSIAILAIFCVSVRRRRSLQNLIFEVDTQVPECKSMAAPTRSDQLASLGHNPFSSHFSPLRPTPVHPQSRYP